MTKEPSSMNKDESVGFHKGALSTLVKERQELSRLLQIVEQLMQMHVSALKELGVDLEAEATAQKPEKTASTTPIEERL